MSGFFEVLPLFESVTMACEDCSRYGDSFRVYNHFHLPILYWKLSNRSRYPHLDHKSCLLWKFASCRLVAAVTRKYLLYNTVYCMGKDQRQCIYRLFHLLRNHLRLLDHRSHPNHHLLFVWKHNPSSFLTLVQKLFPEIDLISNSLIWVENSRTLSWLKIDFSFWWRKILHRTI